MKYFSFEPADGRQPNEEHGDKNQDRDHGESAAEVVCLRDKSDRDHRPGQDRDEHRDAAEGFAVSEGARGEEAPVLGRQDLHPERSVWVDLRLRWVIASARLFGCHAYLPRQGTPLGRMAG